MQTGTLAFLLGVMLFQFHEVAPTTPWLFTIAVIPLLLIPLKRRVALLLLALMAGYLWTTFLVQQRLADNLPPSLEGEEVLIQGYIASLPEVSARRSRFLFQVESLRHQDEERVSPSLVRLSWYQGAPILRPVERWQLNGSPEASKGHDESRWLRL